MVNVLLILEALLIIIYFVAQILEYVCIALPAAGRFIWALYAEFIVLFGAVAVLVCKKWPWVNKRDNTALVAGHLLLYGVIFVSYGKFESAYAHMDELFDKFRRYTGIPLENIDSISLSFLNRSFVLILALAAAFFIPRVLKMPFIQKYLQRRTLAAMGCISAYMAFAAFGEALFLQEFSVVTLSVYLVSVLWMLPISLEILAIYELLALRWQNRDVLPQKRSSRFVWLNAFGILVLIWLIYLVARNPAHMGNDSNKMWLEAASEERIGYLAFPTFVIILARILINIIPHPSFLALVQIFFMAAICACYMLEFHKRGFSLHFIRWFCLVFAALPSNGFLITSIYSNVLYTISLLYITYTMLKLLSPERGKVLPYLNVALALPLVFFTRYTGFIPAALCIIFFIGKAVFKPRSLKALVAVLAGCVLIALIQFPIYKAFRVQDENNSAGGSFVLVNGLISVVYYDGKLSEETRAFLESYMTLEEWKATYSPYSAGSMHNSVMQSTEDDTLTGKLFGHYLETLKREPFILIKDRLTHSNMLWAIVEPPDAGNERVGIYTTSAGIGFPRKENILSTVILKLLYPVTIALAPLDVLFYRSGVYVVLVLLLCAFLALRVAYRRMLLFLPLFGDMLALLLAMGWPSYRNVWFIPVIFAMLAPILLSLLSSGDTLSEKE